MAAETTNAGPEKEQIKLLQTKKIAYSSSVGMEKCSFMWTVENFSTIASKNGSSKVSPMFPSEKDDSQQCKWTLTLYPRGENDAKKEYLGLKLTLKKGPPSNPEMFAVFDLRLKTANDQEICLRTDDKKFIVETSYTWEQLPKIHHLNKVMENDVLVIDFSITCNVTEIDKYYEPEPPIAFLRMVDDYSSLRKSCKLCDAVVIVEDVRIPVHSVVLAARSPVFMAMFEHSTTEKKSKTVEVVDVDCKTMQYLLDFIYSCDLPEFDVQKAKELLKAADKYDLADLKEHCAIHLAMSLNTSNVVDILLLADTHSAEQLKERAIDFICANKVKFTGLENFNPLLQHGGSILIDILQKMSAAK